MSRQNAEQQNGQEGATQEPAGGKFTIRGKVKPAGADDFNYGKDYDVEVVTTVTWRTVEELVALAKKQAQVLYAGKLRAGMGNFSKDNSPVYVTEKQWRDYVAKRSTEVSCDFLLSPTTKKDTKAAVNAEMILRFMRGMNMTREQAINFCEENNLLE